MEEYEPHQEYGDVPGNFGGKSPVAETQSMRLRRECIEWIRLKFPGNGQHDVAREIMEHCFSVASKLLGKDKPMTTLKPENMQVGKPRIDPGFSMLASMEGMIKVAMKMVHEANAKWWIDPITGERKERNVGEMLMLTVSELSEAMEGHRKNKMDDHLPHRKNFDVELADAFIRILDMAAGTGADLAGAFRDKMEYNATRIDHTLEARLAPGGKKY